MALAGAAGEDEPAEEDGGEVVFTEVESADEGFVAEIRDDLGVENAGERGDRSSSWRWPGTGWSDRMSRTLPARLSRRSPLAARVTSDAGYLRAILGSGSILLPLLGAALGALAVHSVDGQALPPTFALAGGLAVVGVFDAFAGVVGVAVFSAGIIAMGGVASGNEARTLLGLATLWFAAPIVAGTARPLRRPPTLSLQEHWDRGADVVIASLIGAWAVQSIIGGLPGLSGLDLPIADRADEIALLVLAALAARMVLETVASHWYPGRLVRVQPDELEEPSPAQRAAASLLVLGVFAFVAVSFLGPCWQLYLGGALFVLPKLLGLVDDRFPNMPRLYGALPKGIVETVLMLVVGSVLGALVLAHVSGGENAIRNAFVLLSLPGTVLALLELFGREGIDRELRWGHRLLGIPILVFGVLLALGVIAF